MMYNLYVQLILYILLYSKVILLKVFFDLLMFVSVVDIDT